MKLRTLLLCCTLMFAGAALAKEAAPMAADVEVEKRMVAISEELPEAPVPMSRRSKFSVVVEFGETVTGEEETAGSRPSDWPLPLVSRKARTA